MNEKTLDLLMRWVDAELFAAVEAVVAGTDGTNEVRAATARRELQEHVSVSQANRQVYGASCTSARSEIGGGDGRVCPNT